MNNKKYIYESPDGGDTIYVREFGKDNRIKLRVEKEVYSKPSRNIQAEKQPFDFFKKFFG